MRWDVFCRVIDNLGDVGVCWRLARQLVSEQQGIVRLWIDDLAPLTRLCPAAEGDRRVQHVEGIEVRFWSADFPGDVAAEGGRRKAEGGRPEKTTAEGDLFPSTLNPQLSTACEASWQAATADVVIEAFACELPQHYEQVMSTWSPPPVWINLEYLSAESWVEDCHLLPSMVTGPASKVPKYFVFPGFTERTGGLLREHDHSAARQRFLATGIEPFRQTLGIGLRRPNELCISLFCYENSALPALMDHWAEQHGPILLLVSPGLPADQVGRWLGQTLRPGMSVDRGSLILHGLPFLPQDRYDAVPWMCDVNFVRGEDSFVRAQWAEKPFVWQIYPQDEQAHQKKLAAFLDRYLEGYEPADVVRDLWDCWNGITPPDRIGEAWNRFAEHLAALEIHATRWADRLNRHGNLADVLAKFARSHQNR